MTGWHGIEGEFGIRRWGALCIIQFNSISFFYFFYFFLGGLFVFRIYPRWLIYWFICSISSPSSSFNFFFFVLGRERERERGNGVDIGRYTGWDCSWFVGRVHWMRSQPHRSSFRTNERGWVDNLSAKRRVLSVQSCSDIFFILYSLLLNPCTGIRRRS